MNPRTDVEARRPVWTALSELFLDTHLTAADCDRIARVLAASPYSDVELHEILLWEVYPACHTNLYSIAGEWSGFDERWLESKILKGYWLPRRLWTATVGRLSVFSSWNWKAIRNRVREMRGGSSD